MGVQALFGGAGLSALNASANKADTSTAALAPASQPSDALSPTPDRPSTLALSQLQAGIYQPRTRMDEGALYELAQSIRSQGVMQPILVRPLPSDPTTGEPRFEIIAGERRFRAARLAGLDTVPVLVREVSNEAAAVMALVENIQREDLNPLEEAQGLSRLVHEFGLTHEQAAQAVGRSRSAATNLLRLLQLSQPVQAMLMAGDLDMGHARALLPLPAAEQVQCAQHIAARKLNVRQAEALVKKNTANIQADVQPALTRASPHKDRDLIRAQQALSDLLTTNVEIRLKKRDTTTCTGEIALTFSSLGELNALIARLGGKDFEF